MKISKVELIVVPCIILALSVCLFFGIQKLKESRRANHLIDTHFPDPEEKP